MADIFVSYAREDEGRIAALVQLLEAQGLSIFWDRHIPPGTSWRDHIGQALADARCVIVAWSHHSIVSSFVAEEADDARARGILVPVMIDSVMPPLGFRSLQAADLADLGSDAVPVGFDALLAALRDSIGSAATARPAETARTGLAPPQQGARNKAIGIAVVGATGVLAAWLALRPLAGTATDGKTQPPRPVESRTEPAPVRLGAGRDSVELLGARHPESGGIEITVRVTHRGDAPLTVVGKDVFALVRRGGGVEALLEQNSSPVFFTLQPDSTQKYSLSFNGADAIALRVTLPGQAPQDLMLPGLR